MERAPHHILEPHSEDTVLRGATVKRALQIITWLLVFSSLTACAVHPIPATLDPASPMLRDESLATPREHYDATALAYHSTSQTPREETPRATTASKRKQRKRANVPSTASSRRAPPKAKPSPQASNKPIALSSTRRAAPAEQAYVKASSSAALDFVVEKLSTSGKTPPTGARSSITSFFKWCKKTGKVSFGKKLTPGQVIFFHNTSDANKDGRNNDWYTHVAVVKSVESTGTAYLSSKHGKKLQTFMMTLKYPDMASTESGNPLNSQLRPRKNSDAPYTQYLAGELYAGTCAL